MFLALLLGAAPADAAKSRWMRGTVTRVTDGDTVWIRPAGGGAPRAVRLRGIDAPEICQSHGRAAQRALAARVLGQPVALRVHGRDSYRRYIGDLATASEPDLGAWMVAQGHAWAPARRANGGPHARAQARARAARQGLWARPGAIEPAAFRRRHGSCH